jgi:TolA-binding protein
MFRVRAGEVTVSVVGTRFTVEHQVDEAGDHVRVGVTRGIVEVSATNLKPRRLQAGERWSMGWQLETARPKTEHPTAAELPALPTATSVEAEAPEAAAHAASSASNASHQPETAALLWEAAISDRRRGDSVEEARKYEEILSRFPSDTRAGYAAFELGRVRMDAFKDYAGAIPPLRRAVKMGSGTTFHEHALARLCQSHGFLSQSAACEQTRAQYLDQYPNGAHAHAVASACGKR